MVALQTRRAETTELPPQPPDGNHPPAGPSDRRSFFQAFFAIVAAVAIIGGFYAFGQAMADDEQTPPPADATAVDSAAADDAAAVVAADSHQHDAAAVDDRGFAALANGEEHGHEFTQPVSAADRELLAHQLTLAREVALSYPTLADAEAAGMFRAGPFSPGLGTHMINTRGYAGNADGVMDDEDIRNPLAVMYDGVEPTSKVIGLFYGANTAEPPEGFAGPNDTWHKHSAICMVNRPGGGIDTPLGADHDATQAECDKVGGNLLQQTQYLAHVWAVPGYESPEGVFAHLSSAITCPDGTYNTVDVTEVGTRTSTCLSEA